MANKTAAQKRAERLAAMEQERLALEAEEVEYQKTIKAAVKVAGQARSRVVEDLYEKFGIEPVTKPRRNADGTETQVQADKSEEQRSALLMDAIEALVTERDELRKQVGSGRGEGASHDAASPHSGVQSVTA